MYIYIHIYIYKCVRVCKTVRLPHLRADQDQVNLYLYM